MACDDEDPCTIDDCDLGSCVHKEDETCCEADEECAVDGPCQLGQCDKATLSCVFTVELAACDDGLACTEDTCAFCADGSCPSSCAHVPNENIGGGDACAEPCVSDDECLALVSDACWVSTCVATPDETESVCDVVSAGLPFDSCQDADGDGYAVVDGDCNDDNGAIHPDALDVCDGVDSDCDDLDGDDCCVVADDCPSEGSSVCESVTCENFTCGAVALEDCCLTDEACDDELACTIDTCSLTECLHIPNHSLCEDEDPCTIDTCSVEQAACEFTPSGQEGGKMVVVAPASENLGVTAWNTDGTGPEPLSLGHEAHWLCQTVPAYYYIASRDYDGIDPTSPGGYRGVEIQGGFTTLAKTLTAHGFEASDITFHFGPMSLGADVEAEGWIFGDSLGDSDWGYDPSSFMELRRYQGGVFELRLGGETMVEGNMSFVDLVLPYTDVGGCTLLSAGDLTGITAPLFASAISPTSSAAVQAAGEALMIDTGDDGIVIEFQAVVDSPSAYSSKNGRSGGYMSMASGAMIAKTECSSGESNPEGGEISGP